MNDRHLRVLASIGLAVGGVPSHGWDICTVCIPPRSRMGYRRSGPGYGLRVTDGRVLQGGTRSRGIGLSRLRDRRRHYPLGRSHGPRRKRPVLWSCERPVGVGPLHSSVFRMSFPSSCGSWDWSQQSCSRRLRYRSSQAFSSRPFRPHCLFSPIRSSWPRSSVGCGRSCRLTDRRPQGNEKKKSARNHSATRGGFFLKLPVESSSRHLTPPYRGVSSLPAGRKLNVSPETHHRTNPRISPMFS